MYNFSKNIKWVFRKGINYSKVLKKFIDIVRHVKVLFYLERILSYPELVEGQAL